MEAVHRFNDHIPGVNGQVVGLWTFSLPGESIEQAWLRLIANVDYRVSDTMALTFGANTATDGDPTWGVTVKLHVNF